MEKPVFTDEQRRENAAKIMSVVEPLQMDFNTIVYTFADIIQSTFTAGLTIGRSQEEREKTHEELVTLRNNMVQVLLDNKGNMMHDLIVLSSLIIESVEYAMQQAVKDSQQS